MPCARSWPRHEPADRRLRAARRDRAYRIARSVCRDEGRAQEAVQETFISVWMTRGTYEKERGKVAAFVLSIARHRAIDIARLNDPHAAHRASDERLHTLPAPDSVAEHVAGRAPGPRSAHPARPAPRHSARGHHARLLRPADSHRDRRAPAPSRRHGQRAHAPRPATTTRRHPKLRVLDHPTRFRRAADVRREPVGAPHGRSEHDHCQ